MLESNNKLLLYRRILNLKNNQSKLLVYFVFTKMVNHFKRFQNSKINLNEFVSLYLINYRYSKMQKYIRVRRRLVNYLKEKSELKNLFLDKKRIFTVVQLINKREDFLLQCNNSLYLRNFVNKYLQLLFLNILLCNIKAKIETAFNFPLINNYVLQSFVKFITLNCNELNSKIWLFINKTKKGSNSVLNLEISSVVKGFKYNLYLKSKLLKKTLLNYYNYNYNNSLNLIILSNFQQTVVNRESLQISFNSYFNQFISKNLYNFVFFYLMQKKATLFNSGFFFKLNSITDVLPLFVIEEDEEIGDEDAYLLELFNFYNCESVRLLELKGEDSIIFQTKLDQENSNKSSANTLNLNQLFLENLDVKENSNETKLRYNFQNFSIGEENPRKMSFNKYLAFLGRKITLSAMDRRGLIHRFFDYNVKTFYENVFEETKQGFLLNIDSIKILVTNTFELLENFSKGTLNDLDLLIIGGFKNIKKTQMRRLLLTLLIVRQNLQNLTYEHKELSGHKRLFYFNNLERKLFAKQNEILNKSICDNNSDDQLFFLAVMTVKYFIEQLIEHEIKYDSSTLEKNRRNWYRNELFKLYRNSIFSLAKEVFKSSFNSLIDYSYYRNFYGTYTLALNAQLITLFKIILPSNNIINTSFLNFKNDINSVILNFRMNQKIHSNPYRFRYIRSYRYVFSDSIYSQNLQLNMLFDKINISNTNTFFFLNLVKHLNLSVLTNLYLCQMVYFRILRVLQELRLLHLESFYFNRNNISVFSRSKIPSIYFYILSVLFYLKRSNLKFYENFWLITPKNKIKRNKLRIYRDRRINYNLLNQVRLSYRKRGRGRFGYKNKNKDRGSGQVRGDAYRWLSTVRVMSHALMGRIKKRYFKIVRRFAFKNKNKNKHKFKSFKIKSNSKKKLHKVVKYRAKIICLHKKRLSKFNVLLKKNKHDIQVNTLSVNYVNVNFIRKDFVNLVSSLKKKNSVRKKSENKFKKKKNSLAICFIKLFLIKIERYNRFIYIIEVLNMIVNTGKVYFTRLLYMNSKFLINFICISKKSYGLFGMDNEKNKAVRKNNKKKFKSNFFGKSDLRQTRTRANKIRKNNRKKNYNDKLHSKFSKARIGHSMGVRRSNTFKVLRKDRDSLPRKKKPNLKKVG